MPKKTNQLGIPGDMADACAAAGAVFMDVFGGT